MRPEDGNFLWIGVIWTGVICAVVGSIGCGATGETVRKTEAPRALRDGGGTTPENPPAPAAVDAGARPGERPAGADRDGGPARDSKPASRNADADTAGEPPIPEPADPDAAHPFLLRLREEMQKNRSPRRSAALDRISLTGTGAADGDRLAARFTDMLVRRLLQRALAATGIGQLREDARHLRRLPLGLGLDTVENGLVNYTLPDFESVACYGLDAERPKKQRARCEAAFSLARIAGKAIGPDARWGPVPSFCSRDPSESICFTAGHPAAGLSDFFSLAESAGVRSGDVFQFSKHALEEMARYARRASVPKRRVGGEALDRLVWGVERWMNEKERARFAGVVTPGSLEGLDPEVEAMAQGLLAERFLDLVWVNSCHANYRRIVNARNRHDRELRADPGLDPFIYRVAGGELVDLEAVTSCACKEDADSPVRCAEAAYATRLMLDFDLEPKSENGVAVETQHLLEHIERAGVKRFVIVRVLTALFKEWVKMGSEERAVKGAGHGPPVNRSGSPGQL